MYIYITLASSHPAPHKLCHNQQFNNNDNNNNNINDNNEM